ncbi:MAG: hypothetical protein HXY28_07530 [Hydrogenophilaceae bacterium]|jgi:flagellar motility protein MotE (MotC chaperone)|nr:hypothetical protein [Hydrogenophilaceae bacterium]
MSKARARQASGVRLLPTIMVTLAALAALKAAALAQGAAEAAPEQGAADATPAAGAQAEAQSCAPASFAEQAGLSQSEVQVLQALGARREQLDQRAAEIETRADLLTAAERRVAQRVEELRRLETQVGALLGRLDDEQEARMANLVDVYQRMRAKDAAAVFDTLDEETLVTVASRMRQANLAEVMGRMAPDRARRLTQMLAERARPIADGQALIARDDAPASR